MSRISGIPRRAAAFALATALSLAALGQDVGSVTDHSPIRTISPSAVVRSTTFVKTYADFISKTTQQKDVTPSDVKATLDGGYILLATSNCTSQPCVLANGGTNEPVSWLVKTDAAGTPQWQHELGCFRSPPGDYTLGASLQQTTDGGYIVGGGAVDCGSAGAASAIVEKLDSSGNLLWARSYPIGPNGGSIFSIKQTANGGFVAAGSLYGPGSVADSAFVLKLDAAGNLQWQRNVGPAGSTYAWFNSVKQTSDGGYVAVGNYYKSSAGNPSTGALVVKLDSSGNLQWQQGINEPAPGSASATSIVQSADGGYLAFGQYFTAASQGPMIVKFDGGGNPQWQIAYNSGTYCYFNGFGETCANIGAYINSVAPAPDGGYVLAGEGNLELRDSIPQVPWLAKVDASGNLLWQYFYYQIHTTGRPLSQFFASTALAPDGGFVAIGSTLNYATQLNLLYTVKTNRSGLCGSCSEVQPATPLIAVDPALTIMSLSLPIGTTAPRGVISPSKTRTTSIKAKKDC